MGLRAIVQTLLSASDKLIDGSPTGAIVRGNAIDAAARCLVGL